MRSLSLVASLLSAIAVSGCGKTTCEKAADSYYAYRSNALSCGLSVSPNFMIGDACSNNIDSCDSSDLSKIETYGACISAIPACDPAKPDDLTTAADACLEGVFPDGLSNKCAAVLGYVCYDLATAHDALVNKAKPCPDLSLAFGTKIEDGCLSGTSGCDAADRKALNAYVSCIKSKELKACVVGSEQTLANGAAACLNTLTAALTADCASGVLAQ